MKILAGVRVQEPQGAVGTIVQGPPNWAVAWEKSGKTTHPSTETVMKYTILGAVAPSTPVSAPAPECHAANSVTDVLVNKYPVRCQVCKRLKLKGEAIVHMTPEGWIGYCI